MQAPGFDLRSPWLNAAGSLGFAPEPRGNVALSVFGAFITNPISVRPRRASAGPRQMNFPGGVLIHTGYPNPGLSASIRRYGRVWAHAELPIIVHLLSAKSDELRKATLRIEELENILAIEVSIEADAGDDLVKEQVRALAGELPVIAQLPIWRAMELAEVAIEAGAAAISLSPPRGALPRPDGKLVNGRLFGPAMFPAALETVRLLAKQKVLLIGGGGVHSRSDGQAMLDAGAMAVQTDVGLWGATSWDSSLARS